MTLEELLALLDQTPVIAQMHPVSTCYLPEDVTVSADAGEVAWLLDSPETTLPRRILILTSEAFYAARFPSVRCDHDPFTPAMNGILFDRYEDVAAKMLCQSKVSSRIVHNSGGSELVGLFLVDGLSYQDVRQWPTLSSQPLELEPCLVDVPTITEVAFPNVVAHPSLPMRMFEVGYHDRIGFTYWTREDNELTDILFQGFADVRKMVDYAQCLSGISQCVEESDTRRCYFQILRTGLDSYAHSQKRRIPADLIVQQLWGEFSKLIDLCTGLSEKFGIGASLYLTADHGILWRDEFEPQVVGDAPGKSSLRWCGWRDLYQQRDTGKRFFVQGEEYYCLDFPKVRRPLHIDEQGVHGGISFQESIVPFVTVRIGI